MTPVIAVTVLVVFLVVLARSLVRNAIALKRDFTTRFDQIQLRLEDEANSMVLRFLNERADADPTETSNNKPVKA